MKTTARVILFLIIVAGMTVSLRILIHRVKYEKENRTVEVLVDYNDLTASVPIGRSMSTVLDEVAAAGVTTIGVYEDTLKSMLESGDVVSLPYKIVVQPRGLTRGEDISEPKNVRVVFARSTQAGDRLRAYLPAYFGKDVCPEGLRYCYLPIFSDQDENLTIGMSAVPETSLYISPRFTNTPYETKESIRLKFQELSNLPHISPVIFEGETVLGYPAIIKEVAKEMNGHQLVLGWVEMVKQDGIEELKRFSENTIPVHSISLEEMKKSTRDENIRRFVRAVSERGVRIIYVHLPVENTGIGGTELMMENMKYLFSLVSAIKDAGFKVGKAQPLPLFRTSGFQRAVVFTGMIAFCLLLLSFLTNIPAWILIAGGILCFPFYEIVTKFGMEGLLAKIGVLAVACIVPGCAVSFAFMRGRAIPEGKPLFMNPVEVITAWLNCTLLSLLGGMFIASFLARQEYFTHIDVFSGIKFAFLIPLVLVFWFFLRWSRVGVREFVEKPVRYLDVIIGIVLLCAVAVYLLRSGNTDLSMTSGMEKNVRNLLETLFAVRPRTKEFLIGHPALLLSSLIPFSRGSLLPLIVLIIGTTGQVSIINTFCHIHTPLMLSLERTMMGIVFGALIGICAREILRLVLRIKYSKGN